MEVISTSRIRLDMIIDALKSSPLADKVVGNPRVDYDTTEDPNADVPFVIIKVRFSGFTGFEFSTSAGRDDDDETCTVYDPQQDRYIRFETVKDAVEAVLLVDTKKVSGWDDFEFVGLIPDDE